MRSAYYKNCMRFLRVCSDWLNTGQSKHADCCEPEKDFQKGSLVHVKLSSLKPMIGFILNFGNRKGNSKHVAFYPDLASSRSIWANKMKNAYGFTEALLRTPARRSNWGYQSRSESVSLPWASSCFRRLSPLVASAREMPESCGVPVMKFADSPP